MLSKSFFVKISTVLWWLLSDLVPCLENNGYGVAILASEESVTLEE